MTRKMLAEREKWQQLSTSGYTMLANPLLIDIIPATHGGIKKKRPRQRLSLTLIRKTKSAYFLVVFGKLKTIPV